MNEKGRRSQSFFPYRAVTDNSDRQTEHLPYLWRMFTVFRQRVTPTAGGNRRTTIIGRKHPRDGIAVERDRMVTLPKKVQVSHAL